MNGATLAIALVVVVGVVKLTAGKSVAGITWSGSVASWSPYLAGGAEQAGLSLAFVLSWLKWESGGNPFATGGSIATAAEAQKRGRAIGEARTLGPDGHPQEMALSQVYNPDDLRALGITGDQLRAGALRTTQKAARALTDAEKRFHADVAIRHMARCRDRARTAMTAAHVTWNERDRYTLAKLVHGLPGLVKASVLVGTTSWAEYRAKLERTKLDAGTEAYRSEFSRIFANAEKTAAVLG